MNGVEAAVARVIRIELEMGEASAVPGFVGEPVEDPRFRVAPVEIEIDGEFFCFFIDDVERAVHVVDEDPLCPAAGLLAQAVHARQHGVGLAAAVQLARDRHDDEVLQLDGQLVLGEQCCRQQGEQRTRSIPAESEGARFS